MLAEYLPMNAAALMDRVFDLYKATFKTQIAFSLIIGIISFALLLALGMMMIFSVGIAAGLTGEINEQNILIIVLIALIGILPLYIGWLYLSSSGHILISKQAFYGEPIGLPFVDAIKVFFRVISAGAAQLILSSPWLAILGFLIYSAASGYDDILEFLIDIHPVTLIVGGFVYVALYVVYSNIFALSVPVAIFEKRLFFTTITRSMQLLKGDFMRVLGLRLLWAVLIYLFSYSAQSLVVLLVAALTAFAGHVIDLGYIWIATGPLQFYVSLFITILVGPMEGIMTALIYFNQKIKKDGLDIEIGLSRLSRGATL